MKDKINEIIKRDMPHLIEEIAEEVYQNGKIDIFEKTDAEYIVKYMHIETDIMVKRVMLALSEIVYREKDK